MLDFLREHELEPQTIVVALADHGEGLGDHHEIEHAYLLNEEVLHVPWIVAGPSVVPGHRVPALVSLGDVTLAVAIEQRLALHALEKPFLAPRAELQSSAAESEGTRLAEE